MNEPSNLEEKAVRELFQFSDFSLADLVLFAEEGHGFCGDDGYYRLTYPNERDEYEATQEGAREIPEGKVEIGYWTGKTSEVLVDLSLYLKMLKEHLILKGEIDLAKRVDSIPIKSGQNW